MLTRINRSTIQRLPLCQFSSFFKDLDKQSRTKMKWDFYKVPEYARIDEGWKLPLAKK